MFLMLYVIGILFATSVYSVLLIVGFSILGWNVSITQSVVTGFTLTVVHTAINYFTRTRNDN